MKERSNERIAIVGIGTLFPDASSPDDYWQNIISKKVSIRPLPEAYFENDIYFRPDLVTSINKQEKSITNLAAWIEDLSFDTVRRYKIPPSVAEHMDENQHAALFAADQAIKNAKLDKTAKDRIAVIYGNGMVGTQYGDGVARVQYQKIEHYLKKYPPFLDLSEAQQKDLLEYVSSVALKDTIPVSEDSAPGILPNIIAARISNAFDFHGPSFTVDAACASVLAAVITGIQGLHHNNYDAVVCGGSDMPLRELGLIYFSAINALSPDGSFPFDKRANGFVMGQGAGAVVLKRLEDAVRDEDEIYAVISGYGQASDGKGKYIAAPNADWQARTIEQAWKMAGCPIDTVEMIEAHGTATVVGDVVEVEGLRSAFQLLGSQRKNYCGLTSAKSNIGHLKSAAGIAGLVKATLALHHKKLPPTANFENINPKLQIEDSPFYIIDELKNWSAVADHPRRAGVSSFGFGGADYHLALEEFRPEDFSTQTSKGVTYSVKHEVAAIQQQGRTADELGTTVLFSSNTFSALEKQVSDFLQECRAEDEVSFNDLAHWHNINYSSKKGKIRLAILTHSADELESRWNLFLKSREQMPVDMLRTKGIYFKEGRSVKAAQTAVLFPGQASQYLNMFRDLYNDLPSIKQRFDQADAYWFKKHKRRVSSMIFQTEGEEEKAQENLRQTENAHPVIFVSSLAIYELLSDWGLRAQYMIGHSLGEITALAAAGNLDFDHALQLVEQRGFAFADTALKDPGKMVSLKTTLDEASKWIESSGIDVHIANINSLQQIIVAGSSPNIDMFKKFLDRKKVANKILFVSHAFHTPLLKDVADTFHKKIKDLSFNRSKTKVIMNHKGDFYPAGKQAESQFSELLKAQILQPVNFVNSVQKLYDEGVRLFVETGPNSILSGLVKDILKDKDITVLTSNFKNTDDLSALQKLNAALFAEGIELNPAAFNRPNKSTPVYVAAPPENKAASGGHPIAASKVIDNRVFYGGVSIGLPGSYKDMFSDDNFEQIFAGHNFIERLTDAERQQMVDLQISKLIKETSGPSFKLLSSLDDVIQLAGKVGKIDLIRDYHLDEKEVKIMTSCIGMGVAAGLEALKDARIPLVREYKKTSTGKMLPQKLALPEEMQEETGVIFANGFPLVDPVIEEVSRFIAHKYGSKTRSELMHFYESIIGQVKDEQAKKLLSDWYTLYYRRLTDGLGVKGVYQFNHHFMMEISAQANNRLASLINAKGPNFQMNAACSSTSNAVTIAEDFIRTGRVERMIVVGADDPTSETNFPYLGAGFLCTGAASNEGDLYRAAVPFDRRRNGMIISAGAVGIILESDKATERRGVRPVAELLGTHSFNTAAHPSQIDISQFSHELQRFIEKMEKKYGIERDSLARDSIYISHETYTPARGGCAQTEAEALRSTFGDSHKEIIIGNTKGMTGHAMGAALEDAVVAKALQMNQCPPVVNYQEPDTELAGLQLSKGGKHNRSHALKMSAGFGSQGNFALLKKTGEGEQRISDENKYQQWLQKISGKKTPQTEQSGRILILKDNQKGTAATVTVTKLDPEIMPKPEDLAKSVQQSVKHDKASILNSVNETITTETDYPPEMLEPEMEFGADLGIGTETQQIIAKKIASRLAISENQVLINDSTTIGQLAASINSSLNDQSKGKEKSTPPQGSFDKPDKETVRTETIKVFAEVTKYPEDMLEADMEMEADLGIDTVKQATILSILGEKYMLERDESIQLSNYPTIGHIVDLIYERSGSGVPQEMEGMISDPEVEASADPPPVSIPAGSDDRKQVEIDTLDVFAEVTKYPPDMLELEMEMEADLGIDTVKQATILSILGEKYMLERDESIQLSNYPTIGHIVDLIYERRNTATGPPPDVENDIPIKPVDLEKVSKPKGTMTIPDVHSLSRQVLVQTERKIGKKAFPLKGKSVWVIGDNKTVVEDLSASIKEKNAKVRSFIFQQKNSATALQNFCSDFIAGQNVDLIIDSSHLGMDVKFSNLDPAKADALLFLNSTARFIFYKQVMETSTKPKKILALTAIDGAMGLHTTAFNDPLYGALSGFYKSLRKEWPQCNVRLVDFDPKYIASEFINIIPQVIKEAEHVSQAVEIAYQKKKRFIIQIDDQANRSSKQIQYGTEDTFLISGGGSGIGALLLKTLGQRYRCKFIVVDIIPMPENIAELAQLDEAGLSKLKQEIHAQLKSGSEKVTPVMLERAFDDKIKAIELHQAIEILNELGCRIEYISCDLTDLAALKPKLDSAREKTGPISAIIHAAGIDKSHPMDRKPIEEFEQVFRVKAVGAYNLLQVTQEDPLKLVVAFSSISGHFGNAAQQDYSAANAFLNHWVKVMTAKYDGLHALSIQWSGWKDIGIAWRNEFVRDYSESIGLNFIEVEQGLSAFIQEIEHPTDDQEILIHNGLDGFIESELGTIKMDDFPLIDRVIKSNGNIEKAYRVFSTKRDALIDQHRLGKTPILPAVAYSELAVEYYALNEGKKDHYLIEHITFENAFKLFYERARELFIEGHKSTGHSVWSIDIKSAFKPPKAPEAQIVTHSRSKVSDELPDFGDMDPKKWNYTNAEPTSLPAEESLMLIKSSGPEQRIILGPLYNDVLRDSEFKEPVLIYPRGTTYPTYFPLAQISNDKYPLDFVLTNPCLVDSLYQACAAHLLVTKKRVYLPWEVGQLAIIDVPREEGMYRTYTEVTAETDEIVTFKVVMLDDSGKVRYFARDVQFRLISL